MRRVIGAIDTVDAQPLGLAQRRATDASVTEEHRLVEQPSARSRSCVASTTMTPAARSARSRATSAAADASSSPVNGSSRSTSRGS